MKATGARLRSVRRLSGLYRYLPDIIIYGYAFLYMYTGVDKLRNISAFIEGNQKNGYIGQHAELIGWGIPLTEILLAVLLILPFMWIKRIALWASTMLMGIFTLYLAWMLVFAEERLCHCGGVIESMGWYTHLLFNLCWLGAGIYAITKQKNRKL